MRVVLSEQILQKYPNARIAIVTASVKVTPSCQYVEDLKSSLADFLHDLGLNKCTYAEHPNIKIWRDIYAKDFNVKPKQYKSSIDALVRRILTGNTVWNISNIVDLYNTCSVKYLLPMGAYDLAKISGDIVIRYGHHGETFEPLGSSQKQPVLPNHIVSADA